MSFTTTAPTEITPLSLHDALPIYRRVPRRALTGEAGPALGDAPEHEALGERSEEHTSELQSHSDLVCRLLLEKKKQGEPEMCSDLEPVRVCTASAAESR